MFCRDFEVFVRYLRPLIPADIPLAGPAAADSYGWRTMDFIQKFHAQIGLVTVHKYMFQPWITDAESHHRPSVENMLQPWAVEEYVQQDVLDTAREHGLPLRYAEINSTTNGAAGISDSFASALWSIDLCFRLVQAGATGINYWPSTTDAPFLYDDQGGLQVKPLYYGMLFFAQAVQNRARLVSVRQTSRANCRAWATVDRRQTLRVMLLNKELHQSIQTTLELPAQNPATLTRLTAPSAGSVQGVRLGGQTFDGSRHGELVGKEKSEQVTPEAELYRVEMPPASAALLEIKL